MSCSPAWCEVMIGHDGRPLRIINGRFSQMYSLRGINGNLPWAEEAEFDSQAPFWCHPANTTSQIDDGNDDHLDFSRLPETNFFDSSEEQQQTDNNFAPTQNDHVTFPSSEFKQIWAPVVESLDSADLPSDHIVSTGIYQRRPTITASEVTIPAGYQSGTTLEPYKFSPEPKKTSSVSEPGESFFNGEEAIMASQPSKAWPILSKLTMTADAHPTEWAGTLIKDTYKGSLTYEGRASPKLLSLSPPSEVEINTTKVKTVPKRARLACDDCRRKKKGCPHKMDKKAE